MATGCCASRAAILAFSDGAGRRPSPSAAAGVPFPHRAGDHGGHRRARLCRNPGHLIATTNSAVTFSPATISKGRVRAGSIGPQSPAARRCSCSIWPRGNLRSVAGRLIYRHGRRSEEPIAVISKATTPSQRVFRVDPRRDRRPHAQKSKPPAIVVVGEVVRLRAALDWLGAPRRATARSDGRLSFPVSPSGTWISPSLSVFSGASAACSDVCGWICAGLKHDKPQKGGAFCINASQLPRVSRNPMAGPAKAVLEIEDLRTHFFHCGRRRAGGRRGVL